MIKDITDSLTKKYTPKGALIIYKCENCYSEQQYYLETRPVKNDGTLGVARSVSADFIKGMVKTFKTEEEMQPHGLMPHNFLLADSRLGHEKYIWWTPPGKKQLYFSSQVAIEDGVYHMPGCVFVAEKEKLQVFCFHKRKPKFDEKLIFGPFFNYYEDGRICLGNAKMEWPKDITWKDVQTHWEKLFWGSINSHIIQNPMKDKINLVVALKESAGKPFDTTILRESDITLQSLLKSNL